MQDNVKNTKRVIQLYYGFQFFFSLLIWLPIFYEFQKRIGLNDSQIFRIQTIYYLVFCFLEIPTGLLADRLGYRFCLRIGAIAVAIANLLPIFLQSYGGFLSHFLLIAFARSLISGASSAYLYDYLSAHGEVSLYKDAEGKARAYSLAGKVVFWSGVGALMQWNLTAPYWLTFATTAVSGVFAWMLPELRVKDLARDVKMVIPFSGLFLVLMRSPFILFLMIQGIAIFVLGRICQVNLFQPILGSKSFSLVAYGWVMSLMTIFEAIGSAQASKIRKFSDDLNAVFLLTGVMAVTLMAIPYVGQIGTVISLCLFALAAGFSFPIQRQLLNDSIPDSKYRATILSVESIADRAVNAWAASLLGASLASGLLDSYLKAAAGFTIIGMSALYIGLRIATPLSLLRRKVHL